MDDERIWIEPSGLRVKGRGEDGGHWEDDEEAKRQEWLLLLQNDLSAQKVPQRTGFFASVTPIALRLVRQAPCLTVWAGMAATFFWNAFQALPEQPFAELFDLPEEVPQHLLAAVGQTAIFLIWSLCFRRTIRDALRDELRSDADD